MKKNLIPLLAVAFVVAIISTGIFYGLIAGNLKGTSTSVMSPVVAARKLEPGKVIGPDDLATGQPDTPAPAGALYSPEAALGRLVVKPVDAGAPLAESSLTPRRPNGEPGHMVPTGMRAVSIHVPETAGVVDLLEPGFHVDVQFLENEGVPPERRALRTVLDNIAVIEVTKEGRSGGRGNRPVVTLLATPAQADVLTLADETGTIRLTLRNPADDASLHAETLRQAALLSGRAGTRRTSAPALARTTPVKPSRSAAGRSRNSGTPVATTPPAPRGVPLHVRFLEVNPEAWEALTAKVPNTESGALEVSAVPSGDDFAQLVHKLEGSQAAKVVSDSRLDLLPGQLATALAGADGRIGRQTSARISFRPGSGPQGQLRVMPEVRRADDAGLRISRLETEVSLAGQQSYLVTGLQPEAEETAGAANQRKILAVITVAPAGERAALKP